MLITRGSASVILPDDWTQTDAQNPDYFESPDGARGVYITAHEKNDSDSDRRVLDFVLKLERDKTRSMKGYKFRFYADSKSSIGNALVGFLDRYAQEKNYRIVSKCIVQQQKVFRAVLHDYDCVDYEDSRRQFDTILDSFAYSPKYAWVPTDTRESIFKNEAIVLDEEGFVDIDLYIASHSENKDGSFLINVANTLDGEPVGFSVLLDKKWTSKKMDNSKASVYWGTGRFISIGRPTENFIEVLSRYYGISAPSISRNETDVAIVGLANDPKYLATREIKMKLFFNTDKQDLYSEVYLNVNLIEKTLEFHEKDQEYREPLVRSMCGEA